MAQITVRQFATPGVLTDESTLFGVKEKVWSQVFTGNFEKELAEVKRRVALLAQEESKLAETKKVIQLEKKIAEIVR